MASKKSKNNEVDLIQEIVDSNPDLYDYDSLKNESDLGLISINQVHYSIFGY